MSTCRNNLKNLSTTKINKNTPSGYSLFTHCSFDTTKNRLNYYRGMKLYEKILSRSNKTCNKNNQLRRKENTS